MAQKIDVPINWTKAGRNIIINIHDIVVHIRYKLELKLYT